MFNKITLSLAMLSLPMHVSADVSEEDIDFSNPTSVYSAFDVNAGTDGVALGLTLAGELSDNWAFLSKLELRENTDMLRVRGAAVANDIGTGFMLDYIKHNDFHIDIEDSKSETLVINAMQVLPFNDGKTMLVPIVGIGYTNNDFARSSTNIWMAQSMIIHNWTDNIWTNFTPIWTNSFSDMEMKNGMANQRIKSFDMEFVAGYRFSGNQNVRLHLNHNEDNKTETWAAYTYAF
ncbi:hypothetical protein [Moritella sp. Urea-trap-13]|uniref:hypothetical protein n=1 Tax=Moritella sp. Urea-trap-13 TaxID=2058327 RepID=UPI000C31DFD1|nr:hypothetical protein [Moritella sp. Urea-trap-13]PKH06006.1 hypothetical protein CXF93_08695 [Moritella sp. Urea-trap-13]